MNLSTVKWAQWDKTQSTELLVLFIYVCSSLCTIVAHNTAQNRPDNFPSCPPDNHHCSNDVYLRERGDMAYRSYNTAWSTIRECNEHMPLQTTADSVVTCLFHDLHTRSRLWVAHTDYRGSRQVLIAVGWWLDQWTRVYNKPCRHRCWPNAVSVLILTDVETFALVKANFNAHFNVYLDISDT